MYIHYRYGNSSKPAAPLPSSPNSVPNNVVIPNATVIVPTTEPPSYASTMQAKAKAQQQQRGGGCSVHPPLPPPPYSVNEDVTQLQHPPLQRKYSPALIDGSGRSDSPQSTGSGESGRLDNGAPPLPPTGMKNLHYLIFYSISSCHF